jgi:hypothetical protein
VSSVQGRVYYTQSRIKGAGVRMQTPLLYSPAYMPGDGALLDTANGPAQGVGGSERVGRSANAGAGASASGDERDVKTNRARDKIVPKLALPLPLPLPRSGVHYYAAPEGRVIDEQRGGAASGRLSERECEGGGGSRAKVALSGRTMLGYAEGVDRNRGLVAKRDVIREFARCW